MPIVLQQTHVRAVHIIAIYWCCTVFILRWARRWRSCRGCRGKRCMASTGSIIGKSSWKLDSADKPRCAWSVWSQKQVWRAFGQWQGAWRMFFAWFKSVVYSYPFLAQNGPGIPVFGYNLKTRSKTSSSYVPSQNPGCPYIHAQTGDASGEWSMLPKACADFSWGCLPEELCNSTLLE